MFPERLKALRLEAGLTQKQISETLGINQPQYARWEKGGREPSKETLQKFAELFNVSVDYLLGNTDVKSNLKLTLTILLKCAEKPLKKIKIKNESHL